MMNKQYLYKYIFVQSLTLGRIPLILVCLVVNLSVDTSQSTFWFTVAFGAMVLSAVTDCFDGYFARRFNVETRLGAYADPLTDKIFYLTAFPMLIFLAANQRIVDGSVLDFGAAFHVKLLLILTVLFLLRDQWVSFLRALGAAHDFDARANWSGKWRTIISFPVVCMIFYYLKAPSDSVYNLIPLYRWPFIVYIGEFVALIINIISIWVYTSYYWPVLKKELSRHNQ